MERGVPSEFDTRAALAGTGYDEQFIGIPAELPSFSSALQEDVLKKPGWAHDAWTPYIHYSVATNTALRQPICSAMNINQDLHKSVGRGGDPWTVDSRIGEQYQLGDAYYKGNPYDRGHLTTRTSNAWGKTDEQALKASISTFSFGNCSLQHENLNQDEWASLEEWVQGLKDDANNKISVYTGPIYGDPDLARRFITPQGMKPAEVPAAFFKIIAFVDKNKRLAIRAFIIVQDAEVLKDKQGRISFDRRKYQVTVKMVEERTGLKFPAEIAAANPLVHSNTVLADELGIPKADLPEVRPVENASHMVDNSRRRPPRIV